MMDGFINVLKPPGMSSHDVVGFVRRLFKVKRVGHAGTLDPGAAGVLPVAVGRAARLIEYLSAADKSYRAELFLGIATDSGDDTGNIIDQAEKFLPLDEIALQAAVRQLTGKIRQIPPAHSAIKIHGQRAYDLVRQNIAVEIPSREVMIYRLEILSRREQSLLLDIDCSKGTYIRTLCTDLGKLLGIPATMSFLVRTRVGDFSLAEAHTLEELAESKEACIEAPERFLSHLPRYDLAPHRKKAFCNGLPTQDRSYHGPAGITRVYGEGLFLGIGSYDAVQNCIFPEKVFL